MSAASQSSHNQNTFTIPKQRRIKTQKSLFKNILIRRIKYDIQLPYCRIQICVFAHTRKRTKEDVSTISTVPQQI